jgi:endoglucanase
MFGVRAIAHTAVALSIAVSGNHFVNGSGQTVRLLGVDRQGTEYACQEGWAYSDGDDTAAAAAADAAAIAAWHANAVRVPLNEDCWLGINGNPHYGTQAGYQAMVETFVNDLNADGIYAILDLHWSAPGSTQADGQRPMPDSQSTTFWASVASTFKDNHAVLFDAFNEPFSPAADGYSSDQLTWSCWENGGCTLPSASDSDTSVPGTYVAVGMQALVTAIRNAGATTQPILLGGLSYSNDLTGWLQNEPTDPDHALVASLHSYEGNTCSSTSCFNSQVAPVAAKVPVVIGEFDEDECPNPNSPPDTYDTDLMNWADQSGVSYLAWGWFTPDSAPDCNDYYLIDQSGNPVAPNGTLLKAHLAALAASTNGPVGTTSATPTSTTTTSGTTTTTTTTGATPTKPVRCVVPKLTGDTLAQARTLLRRADCKVGKVSYRKPKPHISARERRKAPQVVKQTPGRGRSLKTGSKVALVLQRR